jgi:GntR family transcriptional regulator
MCNLYLGTLLDMAKQPLYAQLADQLAHDIARGRYAVGDTLPTELELAAQQQVSRATVRAALASLEARKLVSRRKNAGTKVEAAVSRSDYGANLTSLSDLLQWAQACQRQVQHAHKMVMDQALAHELGCEPGSRWLRIQSLRFDADKGSKPVSWTDAYVDAQYASVISAVQEQPELLISQLLEQQFGLTFTKIEQEVFSTQLNDAMVLALKTDTTSSALRVVRRYLTSTGNAALVTVSVHPEGRFSIKTTLTKT